MTDTAIEIIRLGVSLLEELTDHDEPDNTTIEDTLIGIARTTNRGYKQQTGEFLNPSLIDPEALLD